MSTGEEAQALNAVGLLWPVTTRGRAGSGRLRDDLSQKLYVSAERRNYKTLTVGRTIGTYQCPFFFGREPVHFVSIGQGSHGGPLCQAFKEAARRVGRLQLRVCPCHVQY